ncbi:MAG: hypothetical protein K2N72_07510 [Oscillospiraceae bacterium]|nr:hypothetical protein [Oscillospiraceae bacterium]
MAAVVITAAWFCVSVCRCFFAGIRIFSRLFCLLEIRRAEAFAVSGDNLVWQCTRAQMHL